VLPRLFPSQAGPQNIWVGAKRETVAVLFLPDRGMRSGRETKSLVCVPLWWSFSLGTINTLGIHRWIEKNDAYGVHLIRSNLWIINRCDVI
jgi:hypothetical protein